MGTSTLHIVYLYKDYWPVMGGIESHLQTLAEGVAASGHRVSVVVCQPQHQMCASCETINGVTIYRVARHIDIASSPFSVQLSSIVRQLQPDLVHLQMPWPGGDVTLLLCDVPYVVTYQSDVVRQQRLLLFYAPLLRRTLRRARAIITTSPQYCDTSPWLQPHQQRCSVIPLGIHAPAAPDPVRVAFWRERFPHGCVLWVGRMRYYKGLHILMAALVDAPATLHMVLVGDGPMATEITTLVHQYGLESRVHLLGSLADEDVRALHAVARFFVFPSHLRAEAFGLALLEALYAGLPAISCEVGTATSFVNRHQLTGVVVPPADVPALRDALTLLWDEPALCERYAHNAAIWAATQFAATQMVDATIALYQRVIATS